MEPVQYAANTMREQLAILMAETLLAKGYGIKSLDIQGAPVIPEECLGRVRNHRPTLVAESPNGRPTYVDVILCDGTDGNRDEIVSRLQLFSSIASHDKGEFHVAFPRDGNDDPNDSNEMMIRRIINFHELPVDQVWPIGKD